MGELITPALNFFTEDPVQIAIVGYDDLIVQPVNNVDIGAGIEFFVNGFNDSLKDLSEIHLMATIRLLKSAGDVYKSTEPQPTLINGGLNSLFKTCSLFLNQVLVQEIDNYSIISHINNTLNFSAETTQSRMSNQGFFAGSDEEGRLAQLNESKQLQMMTKINIFNSGKYLIPNVSMALKLDFNSPSFYIVEKPNGVDGTGGTTSKIEITEVKLIVRHFALRAPFLLHIESALAKKVTAKYCYQYCHAVTCTIGAGASSYSNNSLWNGIRPSLMLLAFLKNSTFVGDPLTDPLIFTPHNLSDVKFTINNLDYPRGGLQFKHDAKESKYARIFHALHSSLGIHSENVSTNVTRDNFLTTNFFVVHDCSNFAQSLSTLREPLSLVNAGISVSFSQALASPLTCVLFMLLPRRVEIDGLRKVKVIY